jgi:hypothetical protein
MAIKSTCNTDVSFEGAVLEVYNRDYRAMSDVYTYATFALVWNNNKTEEVLVNANFECDINNGKAVVDALPEVRAAYEAYEKAREDAAEKAREDAARKRMEAETKRPSKGRMVKVYKGRKIPVGTTGYVFWEGFDSYGNPKIGIATTPAKAVQPGKRYASFVDVVWVAAANCEALADQTGVENYQN